MLMSLVTSDPYLEGVLNAMDLAWGGQNNAPSLMLHFVSTLSVLRPTKSLISESTGLPLSCAKF